MEIGLWFVAKKVIAALFLPPFGPLLIMILGAVLVDKARISGRVLFLGGAAMAFFLSLPIVADLSQWTFERNDPPIKEIPVAAQAIVILGGGRALGATEWGGETVSTTTLARLRYGAWLAKLSHLPVMVTGGKPDGGRRAEAFWMAQVLREDFGVVPRWQEDQSVDTAHNASDCRAILAPLNIDQVVLVTDVVHMPRSMADFQEVGFTPIAAPVNFASRAPIGWMSFLPQASAYVRSSESLREGIGLIWQHARAEVQMH